MLSCGHLCFQYYTLIDNKILHDNILIRDPSHKSVRSTMILQIVKSTHVTISLYNLMKKFNIYDVSFCNVFQIFLESQFLYYTLHKLYIWICSCIWNCYVFEYFVNHNFSMQVIFHYYMLDKNLQTCTQSFPIIYL